MDNLPKEENSQKEAGEIFTSGEQQSAYQEAINTPEDEQNQITNEPGADIESQTAESPYPVEGGGGESFPPIAEDKRKKFIVMGIGALIIIFIFLLLFSAFRLLTRKPTTSVVKKNVSLTYWGLWEEAEIVKQVIDDYQRLNPHVKIDYIKQDAKQYRERLQAAIDRGEGPDIFRYHNSWIPMLIKQLAPLPKTVYADSEMESTFYPVVKDDLKVAEFYYGIPLEIDGLLLFYNEDILNGANASVPTTWVELVTTASNLTVKEDEKIVTAGLALGTSDNVEHASDILSLMMLQNGTQFSKSLFSCLDTSTKNCAVDALSFYHKFVEKPDNSWDTTLDNSILAFSRGKVAMILSPSWQAHVIATINPDLKFKTAQVPQLPCETTPCPSIHWATYWVEGVSVKSKSIEESWNFIKFLSSAETLQKLYAEQIKYRKLFGEPYSRKDMAQLLSDNQYLAPLILSAPNMRSFYTASRTFDGETGLNSSLIKYLKDAINSLDKPGGSAETALKTVDNGFQQVYSRFGISSISN